MILVAQDDVLRGLKKFKRLAKQDLLASNMTSNPHFWQSMAEARRRTYDELMELVERVGVENAYVKALDNYRSIRPLASENPDTKGRQQALEMFFTILGIDKRSLVEDGIPRQFDTKMNSEISAEVTTS